MIGWGDWTGETGQSPFSFSEDDMIPLVLAVVALILALYHGIVGSAKFPYLWVPVLLLALSVVALTYGMAFGPTAGFGK